jgi:hypothetical protein
MKKTRFFAMGLLVLGLIFAACGSTGGGGVPQKDSAVDQNRIKHYGEEMQRLIENGLPAAEIERQLQDLLDKNSLTQAEYQQLVNESKAKAAERQAKAEAEKQAKEEAARKAAEERRALAERQEQERRAAIDAANAKGVSAEDFEYDINSKGDGILIKKYNGLATIVNIPATIEGYPVKELGEMIFYGNDNITSVTIPDSVTAIYSVSSKDNHLRYSEYSSGPVGVSHGIFGNCRKLQSVTLSKNIKSIPHAAFGFCRDLTSITIPNGVTAIGAFAFYECTRLQSVTLPDSLIEIMEGAFAGTGLTDIVLPKSLGGLNSRGWWGDQGAFQNCTNLKNVTFQSNNLVIGYRSFAGCTALESLTINGNISRIDNDDDSDTGVFNGCSFTAVNIGSNVTKIVNVDLILEKGANLPLATRAALNKVR